MIGGEWMKRRENGKRSGSILWKHMIMMLSVLLLAVIALVVIHQMSLQTMTEENLTSMAHHLERSCSQMESDMFLTMGLPAAIENTEYYRYLRNDYSGVLEKNTPRFCI